MVAFLATAAAIGAPEVELRHLARWTTVTTNTAGIASMTLDGDRLYVCHRDAGLLIYDVANPSVPVRLGTFPSPGWAVKVAILGNIAFLSDVPSGLLTLDVSDATRPVQLGRFADVQSAFGVAVRDQFAFLGAGDKGFVVVDFSNPSLPRRVGRLELDSAGAVVLSGSHAYVANGTNGISVVDISIPSSPFLVTTVVDGTRRPGTLAVSGTTLCSSDVGRGLALFDISQPNHPVLRETPFGSRLALANGVAANSQFIGLVSSFSQTPALLIFDIGAPSRRIYGPSFQPNIGAAIAMDERQVFVGSAVRQLDAFSVEVSDLQSVSRTPLHQGRFRPLEGFPTIEGATEKSLHVSNTEQLESFSTENPLVPVATFTNQLSVSQMAIAGPQGVAIGKSGWWPSTLDFSNPPTPRLVTFLPEVITNQPFFVETQAVVADSGRAFIGLSRGLCWVDISNASQPQVLATDTNAVSFQSLALRGNRLYAITDYRSLKVFDISIPGTLELRSTQAIEAPRTGFRIFLSQDRLYLLQSTPLTADRQTLGVFSLENPDSPKFIGGFNGPEMSNLVLQEPLLYGLLRSGGIEVLDVRNPASIQRVAGSSLLVSGIATDGRALYATTDSELRVFPFLALTPSFEPLNVGLKEGRLSFGIRGIIGARVQVARATSLDSWNLWRTVTFDREVVEIGDEASESTQFYRIVLP